MRRHIRVTYSAQKNLRRSVPNDTKKRRFHRRNPLKPKALTARLDELTELGLSQDVRETLSTDLSETNVNPSNAIYLLDWWKARLTFLQFIELPERPEPKLQNQYLVVLQNYATKYKLTAYDMALDGEFQIDYGEELRHFIQMSGVNPYFKEPWPELHRIDVDLPTGWYAAAPIERETWLGKLVKTDIKLSDTQPGYEAGVPALKLLRGKYWSDPAGNTRQTEIPQAAIVSTEVTHKPSYVLEFLKEAELSLEETKFYIPQYNVPFLSFPDGTAWTLVADIDRNAEKKSLGDCASGEYTDTAMVIISLREPVMKSPKGQYYRTLLRAELVFPESVPRNPRYEQFRHSVGVINQLRGYANSKPKAAYHKYIVPLLAQEWVAHLIRPAHRPDDIFWYNDLSPTDREFLQAQNPKLFDARVFYEQLKDLDFPDRLEQKIIEGIDFPTPYLVEVLADITPREFGSRPASPRGKIVTRAIERRLKDAVPDPELRSFLAAAEAAVMRMGSPEIATQFGQAGFELSTERILQIFQASLMTGAPTATAGAHPLYSLAASSLKQKLAQRLDQREPGLDEIVKLARLILLEHADESGWPPRHNIYAAILDAGVGLDVEQITHILQTVHPPLRNDNYPWNLALRSVEILDAANRPLGDIPSILERIVLDPSTPYERVGQILNLSVVELTEKQITDILQEELLHPNRTLAALNSLQDKLQAGKLQQPKKTLRIAHEAMLRLKHRPIAEQTIPWINLPTHGILKILQAPRIHPDIRNTAYIALKYKIDHGDAQIRDTAYRVVKDLLLRSKDKSLIKKLIRLYDGHQKQYQLFYKLATIRIEWLTEDRNRTFFLGLIASSLPGSQISYRYAVQLPMPIYRLLAKLVGDDLIEDNCSFVLKLLFDTRFDDKSLKLARMLLERVLDAIIEKPGKLTSETCHWIQSEPKGWGSSVHRTFANVIPLSPKLSHQFRQLFAITEKTGNDCYLDLAVSIAQIMEQKDRAKLYSLALPLVKAIFSGEGRTRRNDYADYLARLLRIRRHMKRY